MLSDGKSEQVLICLSDYGPQLNLNNSMRFHQRKPQYARICLFILEEIIYFAKHEQTCNERVILYKESKMYYKYNWACVVSIKM